MFLLPDGEYRVGKMSYSVGEMVYHTIFEHCQAKTLDLSFFVFCNQDDEPWK